MLKKSILFVVVTFMFSMTTFSQFGIKGGFALGIPTNSGSNKPNTYTGFDVGAFYDLTDHFQVEVLYEGMFHTTSNSFAKTTTTVMPITVGALYSFLDGKAHPYVGLNLGAYIYTGSVNIGGGNASSSNSRFGLYPKAGILYDVTDNLFIDFTAKYHVNFFKKGGGGTGTGQFFGINAGVGFRF